MVGATGLWGSGLQPAAPPVAHDGLVSLSPEEIQGASLEESQSVLSRGVSKQSWPSHWTLWSKENSLGIVNNLGTIFLSEEHIKDPSNEFRRNE